MNKKIQRPKSYRNKNSRNNVFVAVPGEDGEDWRHKRDAFPPAENHPFHMDPYAVINMVNRFERKPGGKRKK